MNFAQNQKIQKLLKPCNEPMNYLLNYFRALWPTSMKKFKNKLKGNNLILQRIELKSNHHAASTQLKKSGLTTIG